MLGYDRPCMDYPLLTSFRKGWERQQVPLAPAAAMSGLALPASMAFNLYTALPALVAPVALRPVLFSFLSYLLILRPASLLSVQWLRVQDGMLQYKPLHWKGKCFSSDEAPVMQVPVGNMPFVISAVSRLLSARMPGAAGTVWRFRGESAPSTPTAEGWFDTAVRVARFPAEHTGYTLYSTRRGGASAAVAAGVPLHKVETLGGWGAGSAAMRQRYLDHGIAGCQHAKFFFEALVGAPVSAHQHFNA